MTAPVLTPEHTAGPRNRLLLFPIALFLGPLALMLFLGRAKLALAYVIIQFLWLTATLFILRAFNKPLVDAGLDFQSALFLIGSLPAIVALVHALVIRRSSLARPFYSRWFVSLVAAPLLVLALVVCFRTFAHQPFNIPSGSMYPTLIVGDQLFASKSAYGWSRFSLPWRLVNFNGRVWGRAPERGDIVIYRLPADENTDYIARVIGLPGERVRVTRGIVYIDEVPVRKEQIEDFIDPLNGGAQPQYRETLANGVSYRVLDVTPVGSADDTEEYLIPAGHYFMLGDNRDNAMDSRFQAVGFIPKDHFVGRAGMIYWNAFGAPIGERPGGNP